MEKFTADRFSLEPLTLTGIAIRASGALDAARLKGPEAIQGTGLSEFVEVLKYSIESMESSYWLEFPNETMCSIATACQGLTDDLEKANLSTGCAELLKGVVADLINLIAGERIDEQRLLVLRSFCAVLADSLLNQVELPPPPGGAIRLCS